MTRSRPGGDIDFGLTDARALGRRLRGEPLEPRQVPHLLGQAFAHSEAAGYRFAKALAQTATTKEQFVAEGTELFAASVATTSPERRQVIRGVVDATGRAGSLFLLQNMSGLKQADANSYMRDFLVAGGRPADVAAWLQLAGHVLRKHDIHKSDTADVVVDAVGDAAEWVVDTIEDGVDAILEGIDAVLDAMTTAGVAIVNAFEAVVSWTAEQIGDLLAALVEAGVRLGEFIAATFDWAYGAVANFVAAAMEVGFSIADLLENVVAQSYFVLRRFIDGIIRNLGPVGEILDFVLTRAEAAASGLWRSTLLALRFAGANLLDALDWMANQTQQVVVAIIAAWESIGEALETLYQWALTAGSLVWQAIGEATATIGNSIYYAYNFLATSGAQFIFDFTRGLVRAGMAIVSVAGWAVEQAVEVCAEVLRGMLDVGVTIATALVAIVTRPATALQTFLQALAQIGQTLEDVLRAVIIDTAAEFLREVVEALLEIGNAVVDILVAGLKLGGAYLGLLIAELFNRLGTYRGLTDAERADARLVFGNSLDYDLIFVSQEDPLNAIVFGVQDFFNGNPNSRAFVTSNLVNFDVSDGQIDRPTLIHELTHVWQSREVGGIYLAEAIWAQAGGGGYNYGYHDAPESIGTGTGSQTAFGAALRLPVTPDTVEILVGGTVVAADDGGGNLVFFDGASSGTVDYGTGQVTLALAAAPASGAAVEAQRVVSVAVNRTGGPSRLTEGFMTGAGAEAALPGTTFDQYNREQQGQLMMHWFVRRSLAVTGNSGSAIAYDTGPWDPLQATVAAA